MRLEPPSWWYGERPAERLKAALLAPAGAVYGLAGEARFAMARPYRPALPVICIGNFTLGGAGKTPLALEIARLARDWGCRPAFLSRGYGGRIAGPHRVEMERDTAPDVGDEPLLLARAAPAFIARDRQAGARAIEESGADLIIMDDGFQNPALAKDLCLIAVDAGTGTGNGRVFPAGPLRAPLGAQMQRADVIVMIGEGELPARLATEAAKAGIPVMRAGLEASDDPAWLQTAPAVAFCGIGRPAKFFTTLERLGARLAAAIPFPDHHVFTAEDATLLLDTAARAGATLVTTEKDWVRLTGAGGALSELKGKARTLPVRLRVADDDQPQLTALLLRGLGRE